MALPPNLRGSLVDPAIGPGDMPPEMDLEVPVDEPVDFAGGAEVVEMPDGSVVVQSVEEAAAMAEEEALQNLPFDGNLAEFIDEPDLGRIASDLLSRYEDDKTSRQDWEEAYTNGLDLLGVKHAPERTKPFKGASSVTHPLISESVVQFQAQAYKELLPSGGPVKTKIVGLQNAETEAQAARVKEYLNYLVLDEMEEFDPDTDQLLFYLPLSGSTFKKVYYDELLQRPVSCFVPAEDVVVPYSATSLQSAPRITHVLNLGENDLRKKQVMGVYRDVDLVHPGETEQNGVSDKVDEIQGLSPAPQNDDTRTVLEMHVDLDLPGFEDMDEMGVATGVALPYIVTIDTTSTKILAVRRNWRENDALRRKRNYFVHQKFMPGLGFYGFGLIHMLGGLGRAATSLLRQLIDAGTLANLPGGFKTRGVRVRDGDKPIQPGEFRDIDAPGGAVRDSIMPLPYKEPSATLATLLGALVDAGRRFVSVADQNLQNMNQEMPVGTTVALLERGMKVLSAIHKRLHRAQKQELRLLADIVAEHMAVAYPYQLSGGVTPDVMATDFDGRVDILPVSDPNIFSMAQRVALAQEQLKLAQSAPEMHNLHAAYRRMYQALEIQNIDELLPTPPQPQPVDPAAENSAFLMGRPASVFPDQNHEGHIEAHVALLGLPVVRESPSVLGLLYSHVMEHIGLLAREQVATEGGEMLQQAQLAAQGQADVANPQAVAAYAQQVQQAMNDPKAMNDYVALIQAQLIQKYLPQLAVPAPGQDDPLVDIRNREVDLAERKVELSEQQARHDAKLDVAKLKQKDEGEDDRMTLQKLIADERNEVNRERIEATLRMAAMNRNARGV